MRVLYFGKTLMGESGKSTMSGNEFNRMSTIEWKKYNVLPSSVEALK